MAHQSVSSTDPIKIECPHCKSPECFVETEKVNNEDVHSFMCMECGYTTTSLNRVDSDFVKQYEATTAELIKALRWIDDRGLVWYPIVLNFPSFGIIFPDGTSVEDWKWMAAPAVDIPAEDQKKYPIPGQTDKYYTRRIDMKSGQLFTNDKFYDACKFLGFIKS